MKVIRGIKIGGLQQKIFNLALVIILLIVGIYAVTGIVQQRNLAGIVQEAGESQQASIETISEGTMRQVLDASMSQSTALQAYIADELFTDVRGDVTTLQAFAQELFEHRSSFPAHSYSAPDASKDGTPSALVLHEEGVSPGSSRDLGLLANMSEIMLAMFESSDKLNSCFAATTDGCLLLVNDRSGAYVTEQGTIQSLAVRERPWYTQAVEAGELIFTGVEADAYTDTPGLVCAAPVYQNGRLVAVVGADIFLTSIQEYVDSTASDGSFVCVVGSDGKMLFSPEEDGIFSVKLSAEAPDLREDDNQDLAGFVAKALQENTGVQLIPVKDKEFYVAGSPMSTVGWAVLSVTDKEVTDQPTVNLLTQYNEISEEATSAYEKGTRKASRTLIFLTILVTIAAMIGALTMAQRIIQPLETMTRRIKALSGSDVLFEMQDDYRTDDEIEILAESFADLSKRTVDYIGEITRITAEKERIGAELSLATRIQADMLPNIYPAFPDRPEFDIYATMTPAKEVGGDFYDFFLVDDDHLCMIMADVSGKGVPAALFMMASKIMLANQAMMGKSPAKILEDANSAICANNREEMFVTVWLGILEISTGKLTAANAGHEYPAIRMPNGAFELFKDKHGFVIGGMDGMKYKEYELQLVPGSKLFVYTDGVPEATNAENELFGTERMIDTLNRDIGASPDRVLENIRAAVNGFVNEAEQFDDLTMLCMEYRGQK